MEHVKFHYKFLEELTGEGRSVGVKLPVSQNTDVLFQPMEKAGIRLENRFAIQPMEGCDAGENGVPGELTKRRYQRFAESGAGLIWVEAIAILEEARAKPRQLCLKEETLDALKAMLDDIRETSMKKHGFAPMLIMQAAHSGRYANPNGYSEPIIAYNNPLFEKTGPIDPSRIITDDQLKALEERFGWAAHMAEKAGFDGVDVKCCHRYLLSEFLSAYNREGAYGGSFENRTRLFRNSVKAAKASVSSDFIVTSRMNVYDGFPYPYGFGVKEGEGIVPDLTEGKKLVDMLADELGIKMLDITIGNPYVNPHVNRPYDKGNYIPPEHPLEGIGRLMHCVGEIQRHRPEMLIIGSGFSYPREFAPYLAAGMVEQGGCSVAGFGRMAFAYPDFIQDLRNTGKIDSKKCCISCGECAKLLRAGACAGCVMRDRTQYKPVDML